MPDRIDRLLEDGLLRGMIEALLADQRRCASAGAAGDPAVTQQKGQGVACRLRCRSSAAAGREPPVLGRPCLALLAYRPASLPINHSTAAGELAISADQSAQSLPRRPSAIATACFVFVESDKGFAMLPPWLALRARGSAGPTRPTLASLARKKAGHQPTTGHKV